MALVRQPLNSSWLLSAGYDEETNILELAAQTGHVYSFSAPKTLFDDLMASDSPGKFFWSNIKGKY